MKKTLTVIIPIHKFSEEIKGYLVKAITSVTNQRDKKQIPTLLLVYHSDIKNELTEYIQASDFGIKIELLENEQKNDYCSQVNYAVDNIKTEYFTILEFDDQLSDAYTKNLHEYIKAYPDASVFLPLTVEVTDKNEFIRYSNDGAWSKSIIQIGELGVLSLQTLTEYTYFLVTGGAFKTKDFIEVGKYKTNIKLTFNYELLLRYAFNNMDIMVMSKLLYLHTTNRVDSLFHQYQMTLIQKEIHHWFEIAKREYYFKTERETKEFFLIEQ
jgi:hypothetical protein